MAVYGDSNCLDSSHQRNPCYNMLIRLIQYVSEVRYVCVTLRDQPQPGSRPDKRKISPGVSTVCLINPGMSCTHLVSGFALMSHRRISRNVQVPSGVSGISDCAKCILLPAQRTVCCL